MDDARDRLLRHQSCIVSSPQCDTITEWDNDATGRPAYAKFIPKENTGRLLVMMWVSILDVAAKDNKIINQTTKL